jgi:hypothetical protein
MQRLTVLLTLVLLSGAVCAAKLYRWVDEDGKVHYSDKVPPQAVEGARSRLNERGIIVEQESAAKTPEERAREEEVERLRKEQQRLIEEQKARDQALLRTFRTEDDIILTRDGKLAAVDAQIKLLQNNIKRLKRQLAEQQRSAANLEKQGSPITKHLRDNIASSQRQIEDAYAAILRREREKAQITASYDMDLKRFRELRNLNAEQAAPAPRDQPAVFLDTLVTCDNAEQCGQYWLKAKTYAKQHATTSLQVDSDRILMTTPPRRNHDLSLTVSRVPLGNGTGEKIFLDVQCRDTALGQEFCNSDAVAKIRAGFRPQLTGP